MKLIFTNFSRLTFFCLLFNILFSINGLAQISTTYTFSQSIGVFTPIIGGTVLGITNNDDQVFTGSSTPSISGPGFPIGFPFTYNGIVYNNFGVNSNGWIRLDTGNISIPDAFYNPPLALANNFQVISALGVDLHGKSGIGELSYLLEGISPNQTIIIQWLNYANFDEALNLNDTINFQIRLNEASNSIDFVYGKINIVGASYFAQVGINGDNLGDFLARQTSTNYSSTATASFNSSTCSLTPTIFPASGLTFSYAVLTGDIDPPVILNDTISPLSSCLAVPHNVTADITDASGIASANIVWTVDGVSQTSILMTNVGSLYSGIIPASGNGIVNYSIVAVDAGVNTLTATEFGVTYEDEYLNLSAGADQLINSGSAVTLMARSPFLEPLKITEVILNAFGAGAQSSFPSYITQVDDNIELTNLSSNPLDISGYSLHYIGNLASIADSIVFPLGTIVPADSLVIVQIGFAINDSANRYFSLQSNFTPFSGDPFGTYLKDPFGNILDAVAINAFTFPNFSGVSSSDFTGSGVISPSGFAGSALGGLDQNDNTNWLQASVTNSTSLGFRNIGLPSFSVPTVSWSGGILPSTVIGTEITTPVHPTPGIYNYVASISDGLCTLTDTVLVNVIVPTIPDAEFSVNNIVGTSGGLNTDFAFTDLSTNLPTSWAWSFIPNTVTYINGTSAGSKNPVVNFNAAGVYTVSLLAGNSAGSNTETKTNLITVTISFCPSAANNSNDDDIGNVTFGQLSNGVDTLPALNNSTSVNTYSDFSNLTPVDFAAGGSYPFSATQINSSFSFFQCRIGVFIDYNQDGVLDSSEYVFTSNLTTSTSRVSFGVITIPATALVGNTKMRVVQIESGFPSPCGTYSYGETEDYTINITPPPANDASVFAIDTPKSGCVLSATEIVRVRVSNGGTNIITNLSVSFSVNGGTPVTEIIAGPIPALTTITYNFIATANLSILGTFTLEAYTSLLGDATPSNDTARKTVVNNPLINTFPYIQDFSAANSWVSTPVIGSENWSIQPSVPIFPPLLPVFGTGVAILADNNFSSPSARYAYACGFDFTNLSFPRAELFVLQDANSSPNSDSIAIDVSTDNGLTYTTAGIIARYNPLFLTPGWGKFEVSLGAYSGLSNVIVAIRGVVTPFSEVAVDQFRIFQPFPLDLGVVSIDSIGLACALSASEPVYVTIKNFGSNTITSSQVSFVVDNGLPITETATINLAPDSSVSYLFTASANLSVLGNHTVQAYTSLTGDFDLANDSNLISFTNNPLVNTFPYIQDFSTANSWVSTPVVGIRNWTIEPSVPTFPALFPVFGTGVAVLSDNNFTTPSARYAYTCGFDFTNLSFPRVELFVLQDANSFNDSIAVDVSTDNGLTFTTVGSIAIENPLFNSPGWGKFEVSLGAYGGQSNVIVAIRGVVNFFSAVAVDRFRIYQPAPIDAGVASVDSLESGCGLSATAPVYVSVKNFGSNIVTSIQINFQVDGGTIVTETANITIDPDSTVSYLFTGTANLSAPGIHEIVAFTTLTGDADAANDSASAIAEAYPSSATPTVNNASVCSGAPAVLTASGTAVTFNWYDALSGGNLLFTGPVYSVSPTTPTNYYVEGTSAVAINVGAVDNTIGTGSPYSFFTEGLVFDVLSPIIIDSVSVYPNSTGLVFVNIFDFFGNLIGTSDSTVIGISQVGQKVSIAVDIAIAPGINYEMNALGSTVTDLYRNSGGAVYPFSAAPYLEITGTINAIFNYYYFFYDWKVSSIGCPSPRATAQVSINTAPVVNLGANQSICVGSTVVLNAGNAGNSYLWSTGALTQTITINVGGTYSVTVTGANGCTASDAITITAGSLPIVSLGVDAVLCPGAVLVLDAGNAGSSYVWSTGATSKTIVISAAGSYSVTVTNAGGCVASDAITISASPAAVSTFTNIQANISQEVTFTPTNPLGTHLWTFGTGGPTSTLASPTFTFSPYGVYQVTHTFTTPDGCSSTTVQLVTVLNVGFNNKFESSFSYTIYPNPIQTETTISYELKDRSQVQVNVYDVLGRKVAELVNATQTSGKHEMRLSSDKFTSGAGVYEIQLMVNGTSETLRVIKAE